MPTAVGPNTKGEENLVFGYDLSDTGNSYKGEPTINLVPNAATFNFGGSYQNGNDGTFITEFGTTGYQMINRGSWNGIYQNFNLVNSGTYTFSAWFKYLGGAASPNGGTVYISNYGSGDVSAGVNKGLIGQWQRVTKTVSVTSPTNVYFYIISYGGTNGGDNHSWQVTMPQIELNSHATPFVGGTRSATQGLLDLTGNSTIDLSNVSFDSNAQMTFDDTNDYIQLASNGTGTVFETQTFTIETVIYPTVDPDTSEAVIWSYDFTSHSSLLYAQHLRLGGASGLGNELGFYWNNGSTYKGMTIGNVIPTLNVHYHIVATYQSGYQAVYVNGELLNSTTEVGTINYYNQEVWISRSNFGGYFGGNIPLLKFYNRALTASEVKSNFNAIKGRFNI